MSESKKRTPGYCRQKKKNKTDAAYVELCGKRFYLGAYNSPESHTEYARLISEWKSQGSVMAPLKSSDEVTVNMLCIKFWAYAQEYYRHSDGTATSEISSYKYAIRPLRELYGDSLVDDFGPLSLKAVRTSMAESEKKAHTKVSTKLSRKYINKQVRRMKSVFKWGVSNELVPADIYHALSTVDGLKKNRSTEVYEADDVVPVPEHLIDPIKPFVSRQIWGMIQLQLLTGMRPEDAYLFNPSYLDMSGSIWVYKPKHHKMAWKGITRRIFLGPKAQSVVQSFLKQDLDCYLFDPKEAAWETRVERQLSRNCVKNRAGVNLVENPKRKAGDHYTSDSYRVSVRRGCDKAFEYPPKMNEKKGQKWLESLSEEEHQKWVRDHRWTPAQLRHNAATKIREEFGIEMAQTILGHQLGSAITEIYAEENIEKAKKIMKKVG